MKRILFFINTLSFLFSLIPNAEAQTNQTVVNGNTTAPVNFTGPGCTYKWVNNTPGIGLPDRGRGNIASFTAVNTGDTPVIATITATPFPTGYAYITNLNSSSVSVIDTSTNTVVSTIGVGLVPYGVATSNDGKFVYVTNETYGTVSVINTATNAVVATIPVGVGSRGMAITPDGSRVYVLDGSAVFVINTTTNSVVVNITAAPYYSWYPPSGIVVSPDGSRVYVAYSGPLSRDSSGYVSVINTSTNTVIAYIPVGVGMGTGPYESILVSPDGTRLYVANSNNTISVINTLTDSVINTIIVTPANGNAPNMAISPDGSRIYMISGLLNNTISIINTATNTEIATINGVGGANDYGISATIGGGLLYVTNFTDNNVYVINTSTNTVIDTIQGFLNPFSFGNFISAGPGCNSSPVTFTITVNPSPLPTIFTSGALTGSIIACAGSISVNPNIQQFIISGSNLSAGISATAPPGFEVSLTLVNGFGSSIIIPETDSIVDSIVVYVRSSASAPSGNIFGNVVLSSPGAVSQNVAVSGIINANVTPSLSIASSENNICFGNPVTFTATPTNGGNSPSYQWQINDSNVGDNTSTYTNNNLQNGDMISCMVTSSIGCTLPVLSSNTISMVVYPIPVVTDGTDTTIQLGTSIALNIPVTGTIVNYTWSPANSLNDPTIKNPIATPLTNTTYELEVTSSGGCSATGKITIDVYTPLLMPNAFTPNGDGKNDIFRIPPSIVVNINYFSVFDRWGNIVFTTGNSSAGWDGTYNGKAQPNGAYVWMIEYVDPLKETTKQLKGTVMLIR